MLVSDFAVSAATTRRFMRTELLLCRAPIHRDWNNPDYGTMIVTVLRLRNVPVAVPRA